MCGTAQPAVVGKGKSARMSCKGKQPAKRMKQMPPSELMTSAILSKGQIAHAMLYSLRLLIDAQKMSASDSSNHILMVGFCLQALEISRHWLYRSSDSAEREWLQKLENCISDFLRGCPVDQAEDAVVMYIDAIKTVGAKFYGGAYPLVLMEMLCYLCTKSERLKASRGRDLVQISSEILLSLTSFFNCDVLSAGSLTEVSVISGNQVKLKRLHSVSDAFFSLLSTERPEDMDLLVKVLNHLWNGCSWLGALQLSVLKMIGKDLRLYAWRFSEGTAVIEAMLQFSVCAYRESRQVAGQDKVDTDEHMDATEREFIFSLAHKLGISSLRIFSGIWQSFLSCHELQQLITMVAPVNDEAGETKSELAPELVGIIEEFYKSRLYHEEDACLLLKRYFKSDDVHCARIVAMILENAEHYHAGAVFQLAQLQAANRRRRKDVMDADIFAIVTKAFENLSRASSPNILECIDWVFTTCTGNRREPARSAFYGKMVELICQHAKSHHEILLRVLQHVESQPSLMKHSTAAELGMALVTGYREHFTSRFNVCGHASYASVIAEMQRARLECRHYVKDGEVIFESEVVNVIRRSHHTKKKLMKLLSGDFPEIKIKLPLLVAGNDEPLRC